MLKTKKVVTTANDRLYQLAAQAGMVLMTAATITGMLELPNHPNSRVVLPGQPVFEMVNESEDLNNPIRREREESAPHFVSYAVSQRTPSRASSK